MASNPVKETEQWNNVSSLRKLPRAEGVVNSKWLYHITSYYNLICNCVLCLILYQNCIINIILRPKMCNPISPSNIKTVL